MKVRSSTATFELLHILNSPVKKNQDGGNPGVPDWTRNQNGSPVRQ